jgi:hypothetical protein
MEVSNTSPQASPLLEQNHFQGKLEVSNSARLSVKTKEGDLVTLSSSSLNSLQGSEKTSSSEDGAIVKEFSSTSLAASRYSIQVQGDLNEEELQAIEDLASRFTPLADKFFNQGDVSLEDTGKVLTSSLGVLQEIDVELRQTITAQFRESRYSRQPTLNPAQQRTQQPDPYFDAKSLQRQEPAPPSPPNIRDIAGLVQSVLETALSKQADQLIGDKKSLKTFEELSSLLRNKVNELLKENLENQQANASEDGITQPNPSEQAVQV